MSTQAPAFASYREFCEATYGSFVQRMEALPAVTLVMSEQPAGDGSVQATPDLVLGRIRHGRGTYQADLGRGRFQGKLGTEDTLLLAPNAFSAIQSSAHHGVELVALPYASLRDTYGEELDLPADGDFGALHAGPLANPAFSHMIATLFGREAYGRPAELLLLEGALTTLVALLALESGQPARVVRHRGGLAGWQLRRAQEALAAIEQHVTLADLAAAANLSPYHFARAFRQSTGMPPHRYQTMLRIERARELLADRKLSIADIAASVGYRDQGHFAAAFRQIVGATPSQYRRERVA